MSNALRNLRHSLRQLRRYPGFAAIPILTLALGIGANTTIFSVVNATLLKALPFAEPDQRLLMHLHPSGQPETFVAVPALVLVVALFSSYVPAWRAARVDPMLALRSE